MITDLDQLIGLFHPNRAALGRFEEVLVTDLPPLARQLLAHEHHMTVTVEAHHGTPVDVRVLARRVTPTHYARQIVLARQADQRIVLYGIMRVRLGFLDAGVRAEVESERVPLGRILIEHDVLRRVQLASLWRILPAPLICEYLELELPGVVYGRTALIYCNHEPAIELLEIVP